MGGRALPERLCFHRMICALLAMISIIPKGRMRMKTFEDYLATVEKEENRSRLRDVLDWVKESFPQLEEKIAWNQPMYTDHGTFIIGFSVSKPHFSVAPEAKGMQIFSQEIAESGYSQGSNLFRIKWSDPVDYPLLARIIRYNIEDKERCTTFWRK